MVDKEIVRRRLERLDGYVTILESLRRYDFDEFIADPEHYGSAERFLQVSIEILIDLGNHVIAEEGHGAVESYGDIPVVLQKKGLIGNDLCERWVRMIGFRNILVHEYLDVDRRLVYEAVHEKLSDLRELQSIFARLMEANDDHDLV